MKKNLKLFVCGFIMCILCMCNVVSVSAGKSEAEIRAQVVNTYAQAKAMASTGSFKGYCNRSTHYQLKALGINYVGGNGIYWNGSAWYGNLTNGAVTPEGYVQRKYGGSNCLYDIVASNNGQPVYNIVVGYGTSYGGGSAGHVMLIHAIINGQVYYTDSYRYNGINEGGLHVESIATYNAGFNKMYHNSMQGAVHFVNNDTVPPTISNIRITDLSRDGYTVTCNVSDNIGIREVKFPTWYQTQGGGEAKWVQGTVNGNTASARININEWGGMEGYYHTHIYAYDMNGNYALGRAESNYVDRTPPSITNVRVTNLSRTGYTVTCTVTDNRGIKEVKFPTWYQTQWGEQAIWLKGTVKGNTASARINVSDWGGMEGYYHTHIYAYDACGNYAQGYAESNNVRDIRVTGIKLSKTSLQLTKKGAQYVLKAAVLPSNASNKSVVWKSNNVRVAKVTQSGKVTAVGNGTTNIVATTRDGRKIGVCKVTVKIPKVVSQAKSIVLNRNSLTLNRGKSYTLKATVLPSSYNAGLKWSSSNPKCVTVANNGNVKALKAGRATITVRTSNGKKATCVIRVR